MGSNINSAGEEKNRHCIIGNNDMELWKFLSCSYLVIQSSCCMSGELHHAVGAWSFKTAFAKLHCQQTSCWWNSTELRYVIRCRLEPICIYQMERGWRLQLDDITNVFTDICYASSWDYLQKRIIYLLYGLRYYPSTPCWYFHTALYQLWK